MLDELKKLFTESVQYTHTAGVIQQVSNILNIVSSHYMKEGDARNAAIDLICQILQEHKDVPAKQDEQNASS